MAEGKTVGSLVVELIGATGSFDKDLKNAFARGETAAKGFEKLLNDIDALRTLIADSEMFRRVIGQTFTAAKNAFLEFRDALGSISNLGTLLGVIADYGPKIVKLSAAFSKISAVLFKITAPLQAIIYIVEKIIVQFKIAAGTATLWEKLKIKVNNLTMAMDRMLIPGGNIAHLFGKLSGLAIKMGLKFKNLGKDVLHVATHPIESLKKGFEKLKDTAEMVTDKIKGAFNKLKTAVSGVSNKIWLGITAAVAGVAVATKKLTNYVIEMGSSIEQAKLTLGQLIKTDVDVFLERLMDKAKKTTMTLDDFIKASVSMVGVFGEGEEFDRAITMTADLTAGLASLGVGAEEVSRSLRKLKTGQIGEALERLSEWGINWRDIFPDVDTVEGLRELGIEVVYERMAVAIEEKFGGLAEKSAKTLAGMKTNIKDTFARMALMVANAGFYDKVVEGTERMLNKLTELEENGTLEDWANKISTYLTGVIELFNSLKLGIIEVFGLEEKFRGLLAGPTKQGGTDTLSKEVEEAKTRLKEIEEIFSHPIDTRSWLTLTQEKKELETFIARIESVGQFGGGGGVEAPPIFKRIEDAIEPALAKVNSFIEALKAEFSKLWAILSGSGGHSGQPAGDRIISALNAMLADVSAKIDLEPFVDMGSRILVKIVEGMQKKSDEYMENKGGVVGAVYGMAEWMMGTGNTYNNGELMDTGK